MFHYKKLVIHMVINFVNGMIYTVEGNSIDDGVRQKIYFINSPVIYVFGVPKYKNKKVLKPFIIGD